MCDKILVTSSEGCFPSSEDSTSTPVVQTLSSPWSLRYNFDSSTSDTYGKLEGNDNFSEKPSWNSKKSGDHSQENECSERPLPLTQFLTRVPYRRLPMSKPQDTKNKSHDSSISSAFSISQKSKLISKQSPIKALQITRKPLAELFEKQLTPENKLQSLRLEHDDDDDDGIFTPTSTPTASRSSSSTSVASSVSISPITPLGRYKKRYEANKTDVDKKASLSEPDMAEKYQMLLTKYFKTRKVMKMLKNQSKLDQKRIALLEFTRQREAEISDPTQESQKYINQEGQQCSQVNAEDEIACVRNEAGWNGYAAEDDGGAQDDESFNAAAYSQVKEEVIKTMLPKISDQALRPVVYNISLDSPPSKMNLFMDRLTKSKKMCENCGKKINIKLND